MYSSMSPFSKTTLDINKLYVSSPMASKIQDEGESDKKDKTEENAVSKQGWFDGSRFAPSANSSDKPRRCL